MALVGKEFSHLDHNILKEFSRRGMRNESVFHCSLKLLAYLHLEREWARGGIPPRLPRPALVILSSLSRTTSPLLEQPFPDPCLVETEEGSGCLFGAQAAVSPCMRVNSQKANSVLKAWTSWGRGVWETRCCGRQKAWGKGTQITIPAPPLHVPTYSWGPSSP